jgi:hypothetical protein
MAFYKRDSWTVDRFMWALAYVSMGLPMEFFLKFFIIMGCAVTRNRPLGKKILIEMTAIEEAMYDRR